VGLAFLAYAVGAVTGAVVSRFVLSRGASRWVRIGTVAMCAALVTPALAPAFGWLVVTFYLGGLCAGFLDVLENAQAAEIERDSGRPMINSFHGFWSFGPIIGVAGAALAATAGLTPLVHFTIVAVVVLVVSVPLL